MPGLPTTNLQGEAWHNEQARRSQDIIRISNPTNEDYYIEWGHPPKFFKVPANGTLDVDRYLAEAYLRDMTVKLINDDVNKMGEQLLQRLGNQKPDILLSKFLENEEVWKRLPHTDNEQLRREKAKLLWVGLVRKHGLDLPPATSQYPDMDLRSIDEKILGDLEEVEIVDTQPSTIFSPVIPEDPPISTESSQTPEKPPLYVSAATKKAMEKEVLESGEDDSTGS